MTKTRAINFQFFFIIPFINYLVDKISVSVADFNS